VAEHVAPADGVARVGRREAGALPPLVTPPLVADGEVISLGHGEHRVVHQPVRPAQARQIGADSPAATERPHGTDARSAADDCVALAHDIALGLLVDRSGEPVLPGADEIVEIVVPWPAGRRAGTAETSRC